MRDDFAKNGGSLMSDVKAELASSYDIPARSARTEAREAEDFVSVLDRAVSAEPSEPQEARPAEAPAEREAATDRDRGGAASDRNRAEAPAHRDHTETSADRDHAANGNDAAAAAEADGRWRSLRAVTRYGMAFVPRAVIALAFVGGLAAGVVHCSDPQQGPVGPDGGADGPYDKDGNPCGALSPVRQRLRDRRLRSPTAVDAGRRAPKGRAASPEPARLCVGRRRRRW